MADEIQIKITAVTTKQVKYLPIIYVESMSCKIARYGGFAEFTINTTLPWSSGLLAWVSYRDIMEIYYKGVRRYRGYVRARTKSEEEPQKLVIEGYGALLGVRNQICNKRIATAISTVDVSSIFSEIANMVVIGSLGPNGTQLISDVEVQNIGVNSSGIDAYNKLSGPVFDDIQNQSANLAVWGCDVNPLDQNRLYLRKITQGPIVDHVLVAPAQGIEVIQSQEQEADVRNILLISGGNPIYPQLCHNGDFKLPVYHQDLATNFLTNGGFESGDTNRTDHVQDWDTHGSGASIKSAAYDPPSIIQPYEGNKCLQLDHAGERVTQVVFNFDNTVGHTYILSVQACKQIDEQVCSGAFFLQLVNGSSVIYDSGSVPLRIPSTGYTYNAIAIAMPRGVTAAIISISCTAINSFGGKQGGLIIDDAQFYDADLIYQDGWGISIPNPSSADIVAINWNKPDPWGGSDVCVYVWANATDSNGHDLILGTTDNAKIKVTPGQDIKLSLYVMSAFLDSFGPSNPKLMLQLRWMRNDGSFVSTYQHVCTEVIQGGYLAIWHKLSVHAFAPSTDTTYVQPAITWRGSGALLIKLVSVMDNSANDTPYVPEGPMSFLIRCDDPQIATQLGYTPPYSLSITKYGDLADTITETSVIRLSDAIAVAHSYFSSKAISTWRPSITLDSDERVYLPGELVALNGLDGVSLLPTPQNIADVTLSWAGSFKTQIDLEKEQEDMVGVIQKIVQDTVKRLGQSGQGNGGSGGYLSNSGGAGGGSISISPTYRESLAASSTDSTLHDAFIEAPHASAALQAGWAATKDEVTSARTRSFLGTSFSSLESRLDAMETSISAGGGGTSGNQVVINTPPYYRFHKKFSILNTIPVASDFTGTDSLTYYANGLDGSIRYETPGLGLNAYWKIKLRNTSLSSVTVNWSIPYIDNYGSGAWNGASLFSINSSTGNLSGTFIIAAGTTGLLELFYANANNGYYDSSNPGTFWFFMDALLSQGIVMVDPDTGLVPGTITVLKRRYKQVFRPPSSTIDSSPNLSQVDELPDGTGVSASYWKLMKATLRVDQPNALPTTAQVYSSTGGDNLFGSGSAVLSSALTVTGASGAGSVEVTTNGFAGTLATIGLISGTAIAPEFTYLGGTKITLTLQWEEA